MYLSTERKEAEQFCSPTVEGAWLPMYFRQSLGVAVLASVFLAGSVEASGMFPLGTNVLAH
ncbi:hypothetical protein, partial [Mitsuokella sp.]|uniref:hypothetical protein n=1 Tax=Mitsuokella sp. TaxID=2049034 RepID=UPI003D7F0E3A